MSRVRGVCAGAPLHSSNPAGGGKQRAKRRTRGKVCHSVEDLQAREVKGWRLKKLTVEPGLPEQVYGGTGPEALSARVYAAVCREFRNILHTWLNRVHFSLAINYIYIYIGSSKSMCSSCQCTLSFRLISQCLHPPGQHGPRSVHALQCGGTLLSML